MERFENISTATHPGIVKDIWTGFQFYCYDADEVAKHLNTITERRKDQHENTQTKNGQKMAPAKPLEDS